MKKIVNKSKYRPDPMHPFKTLDEEADFWDTHDTSLLGKVPLSKLPLLESEKEETLVVRVQKSVKNRIKYIARQKGIDTSTLSRMWLIEKLVEAQKHL